jgi:hypothetical protein
MIATSKDIACHLVSLVEQQDVRLTEPQRATLLAQIEGTVADYRLDICWTAANIIDQDTENDGGRLRGLKRSVLELGVEEIR